MVPPAADPYWHTVQQYIHKNKWQSGENLISQILNAANTYGWLNGEQTSTDGILSDGTAPDWVQKYIAYYLSVMTAEYRKTLSLSEQRNNSNYALGYVWITRPDGSISVATMVGAPGGSDNPARGQDNDDPAIGPPSQTHSENRIIQRLKSELFPIFLSSDLIPKGSTVNVVIYSQTRFCNNGCRADFKQWQSQLQQQTGGSTVHIYGWEPPLGANYRYVAPSDPSGLVPFQP